MPQLQAELALQRRSLTLWQSPVATLRLFTANASTTVVRGLLWTVQHPLMLFIALPLVGAYLGLKYTGQTGSRSRIQHRISASHAVCHGQSLSCRHRMAASLNSFQRFKLSCREESRPPHHIEGIPRKCCRTPYVQDPRECSQPRVHQRNHPPVLCP